MTTKRSDRPQLRKALAHAKRIRATLLIPSIEPLLRNCDFLGALYESAVEFMSLDISYISKEIIYTFLIIAEKENRQKSERIRAALAAHKARGGRLGNP